MGTFSEACSESEGLPLRFVFVRVPLLKPNRRLNPPSSSPPLISSTVFVQSMATVKDSGIEALEKLKSTEPPVFLAPSSISEVARAVSQYLFTKLKPHDPKSQLDQLWVDGFDTEQIWQQIDMQSQHLLPSLRQEVNRFVKNPEEIRKLANLSLKVSHEDDVDEMDMDGSDSDEDNELQASESEGEEEEDDEEEEEEEEDDDGEEEEEEEDGDNEGIEDKFFKIRELEEFLEEGEAQEYGNDYKNKKGVAKRNKQNFSDDEDEEDDEDEDEDDEVSTYHSFFK